MQPGGQILKRRPAAGIILTVILPAFGSPIEIFLYAPSCFKLFGIEVKQAKVAKSGKRLVVFALSFRLHEKSPF